MTEVELPDGTIVEFPEGTPMPDVMKAVKQFDVKSTAKDRVSKMSSFRKALYGAERSLDETAMGIKQIFPKALGGGLDSNERRDLAVRREMEDQIPGSIIPRIAGDVAQWILPSNLALKGAAMIPKLAGTAGRVGAALGIGAASGAIQPTLDGESRSGNAAFGAAMGAGGQVAGDAIGRGIEGVVKRSDAAKSLPKAIQNQMTLGQSADRNLLSGRIIAGTEERLQSIPIVGDAIRSSREQGTNAFRNNVIDKVAPDGFKVPQGATRDKVAAINDEFSKRYVSALKNTKVGPSQLFEQEVLKIVNNPQSGVPREQAEGVVRDIMRNYQSRFAGVQGINTGSTGLATGPTPGRSVQMTGQSAKDFEAFLSAEARGYALQGQQGNPAARNLGKLYEQLEDAWTTSYYRQIGPAARKDLRVLDKKYAPFKTVERAAGSRGTGTPGDFTPAQLDEAVASRTGRSRFARNEGMLQEDATVGRELFGARIPDSGTAERGLMGAVAGGAMVVDPVSAGITLGSLPLLTSGPGKRLMTGETAAQRLAQQLRLNQISRSSGLPAGIAISDITNQESERY